MIGKKGPASPSAIQVIRCHQQLERHFGWDVELGNRHLAVVVLELVVAVLDDLFQNSGRDFRKLDFAFPFQKRVCSVITRRRKQAQRTWQSGSVAIGAASFVMIASAMQRSRMSS